MLCHVWHRAVRLLDAELLEGIAVTNRKRFGIWQLIVMAAVIALLLLLATAEPGVWI